MNRSCWQIARISFLFVITKRSTKRALNTVCLQIYFIVAMVILRKFSHRPSSMSLLFYFHSKPLKCFSRCWMSLNCVWLNKTFPSSAFAETQWGRGENNEEHKTQLCVWNSRLVCEMRRKNAEKTSHTWWTASYLLNSFHCQGSQESIIFLKLLFMTYSSQIQNKNPTWTHELRKTKQKTEKKKGKVKKIVRWKDAA